MSKRGKMPWRYHKKSWNDGEEGASSSQSRSSRNESQQVSETEHSGRHPPGLTGKEIGLWYRSRQKKRTREDWEGEFQLDKWSFEQESPPSIRQKYSYKNRHNLEAWTPKPKCNSAERAQARKERKLEKARLQAEKPLGSIILSESKKANINQLLNQTEESIYPRSFLKKTNSFEHLEETDFKHEFLQHITGNIISKLKAAPSTGEQFKNQFEDDMLLEELTEKKSRKGYQSMQQVRKKLPSMAKKDEILNLIKENQVTVISGETGCGKTTQVAQFILDHYISESRGSECKVICTQPRRISAISVAERVAQERDEKLGLSVGYQIRLEKIAPRQRGSILFCTAGVLLKYMESNPSIKEISHLILDEIHERDVICDFLITLLKEVIKYRTDIKVILMSATLNAEAFSKYFHNAPHINIPGFTWPVKEYFLEDVLQLTDFKILEDRRPIWVRTMNSGKDGENWQELMGPFLRQLEAERNYKKSVIQELWKPNCEKLNVFLIYVLLLKICQEKYDGAILVFVPGFTDIRYLINKMQESGNFPASKYLVFPLHSQLPTVEQRQIFQTPPKGMRKIIISTNIAETSITIDDVTCVIDSGYIKMTNLDVETGIETLKAELVAQANAAQRKGRAGRVRPGTCYHLITKYRYDMLDKFIKPEVLRRRLEDVILTLKMLQLGEAEPFLSTLMDPPETKSIQQSLALLQRMGALTDEEGLTPLGFHMAKLPVEPHCSKMLIMASMFSCLDPILSVAASLGFKDAFQLSTDLKDGDKMKFKLSGDSCSDHITMHYAITGYEEADDKRAFCRKYFLSSSTLNLLINMKEQFAKDLFEMKFVSGPHAKSHSSNLNSNNIPLIKAIIAAGMYPNVAIVDRPKKGKRPTKLRSLNNEMMEFHPKSVMNYVEVIPSPLLVYYLRLKSYGVNVHDATVVYPLSIVFFGDKFRIHDDEQNKFRGISINDNMRFICTKSTSLLIQRLRNQFNEILKWKASHPGFVDWSSTSPETKVLQVIMDLIRTEDAGDLDLSDFEDD